eukprot:9492007-Pyramimonas_sp.AAC.1
MHTSASRWGRRGPYARGVAYGPQGGHMVYSFERRCCDEQYSGLLLTGTPVGVTPLHLRGRAQHPS